MRRNRQLAKVTGKWIKEACHWLWDNKKLGGCYHIPFANSGHHEVCVCVGWTGIDVDDGPGETVTAGKCKIQTFKGHTEDRVAWKIGWQTFNNYMQTDLDIDFDMPWNTKEYCDKMNAKLTEEERKRGVRYCEGDVYNTEETIELKPGKTTPAGYRDWNALAAFIRKTARKVLAYAREVDPEESDY